jgi:hypothetical protein
MRNGTLSNKNKLVLVNSGGQPMDGLDLIDDAAVDYLSGPDNEASLAVEDTHKTRLTLLMLMAVSVACATVAIATGSYAIWLSRQQAARQVLVDVNDILKSCQIRMQQLEADVQKLPERQA